MDDTPDCAEREHPARPPDGTPAFPPTEEHCPCLDIIVPAKSEGADILEKVCTPMNAEAHPLKKHAGEEEDLDDTFIRNHPTGPKAEDANYGEPGETAVADDSMTNASPVTEKDGEESPSFVYEEPTIKPDKKKCPSMAEAFDGPTQTQKACMTKKKGRKVPRYNPKPKHKSITINENMPEETAGSYALKSNGALAPSLVAMATPSTLVITTAPIFPCNHPLGHTNSEACV